MIDTSVVYEIYAEFRAFPKATYPTVSTDQASGVIGFQSPCLSPNFFATTQDQTVPSDKYTGTPVTWTMNEFSMSPDFCTVQYSCTNVSRQDGRPSQLTCDDFQFNELTNVWQTVATQEEYENGTLTPGFFIVTITGVATESSP